jgi:hypothetical protein
MNIISKPSMLLLWSLTAVLMFFTGTTEAVAGDLSGEEVRKLINGNTVEAIHVKLGFSITTYFSPDGTFRQIRDGKRESGTWSIDDQGHLCQNREGWGGECRVITQENNVWKAYKIPDSGYPMKPRKHKRTFKKVLEGNPNNL